MEIYCRFDIMNNVLLQKKFKEFKKYIEQFVTSHKSGIEDIHKLRVSTRELFSSMSVDNLFYSRLKKVIKLSNKIRDRDVFFEIYLDSLPRKYLTKLDIESMRQSTTNSRKKKIDKLHLYLKALVIPKTIVFKYEKSKYMLTIQNKLISPYQVELHKYRIFIKKMLYKEKNSFPLNENKIKTLKIIKDILGTINDNINGINRLQSFDIEVGLFKEIKAFTQEQNLKFFKEFQILDNKYIKD